MTQAEKNEMRMPADEFDRIMKRALQSPPPKQTKTKPTGKQATTKRRRNSAK